MREYRTQDGLAAHLEYVLHIGKGERARSMESVMIETTASPEV